MKIEVIVYDIKVYEFESPIAPTVGEFVKRLHGAFQVWRIDEVRHVIDTAHKCKRIVLIAQEF